MSCWCVTPLEAGPAAQDSDDDGLMCASSNGDVRSASEMGMPEGRPTTTEVRVELEDVGDGTKMVMTHAGILSDSPGAAGWAMACDKLAAHVRSVDR